MSSRYPWGFAGYSVPAPGLGPGGSSEIRVHDFGVGGVYGEGQSDVGVRGFEVWVVGRCREQKVSNPV